MAAIKTEIATYRYRGGFFIGRPFFYALCFAGMNRKQMTDFFLIVAAGVVTHLVIRYLEKREQ